MFTEAFWIEAGKSLRAVLKQAGIQGLLLLILCGIVTYGMYTNNRNAERRERIAQAESQAFRDALKTVTDSLFSIQGRTIVAVTVSSEVIRVNTQAMADNTRTFRRYARRPNQSPEDG